MLYDEANSKKPGGIRVSSGAHQGLGAFRALKHRGLGAFGPWTHRRLRQVGDGSGVP